MSVDDKFKELGLTKQQVGEFVDRNVAEVGGMLLKQVSQSDFPEQVKLFLMGEIVTRIAGITFNAIEADTGLQFQRFAQAILSYSQYQKAEMDDLKDMAVKGNA